MKLKSFKPWMLKQVGKTLKIKSYLVTRSQMLSTSIFHWPLKEKQQKANEREERAQKAEEAEKNEFLNGLDEKRRRNRKSNVVFAGLLGGNASVGLGGRKSLLGL